MKKVLSILLAAILLACALPMASSAANSDYVGEKQRLLALINEQRAKNGISALDMNNTLLQKAADIRAQEIASTFSHTRPNGSSCFTALDEQGLSYRTVGENIAMNNGYADPVAMAVEQWMNSPGHKENILTESFEQTAFGVAASSNGWFFVQIFYTGSNPQPGGLNVGGGSSSVQQVLEGTPFVDCNGHWASDSIKWVYGMSLFSGTDPDRFSPDDYMTRGMFAEVLYRFAGKPAVYEHKAYRDVYSSDYYYNAVNWASQSGVMVGTDTYTFEPNSIITREEIVTSLYRYTSANVQSISSRNVISFPDIQNVSPWALEAVNWACYIGLISGDEHGYINALAPATRAEVAVLFNRFAM